MNDLERLAHCDDFSTATGQPDYGTRPMQISRYVRITTWARNRYTRGGKLETYVGNAPSPLTRIEKAAWRAYCA